jgi:RNA polymerase sigma-54 factor
MKQSLQLRLGQHLTMTPQLQQAIRLLQLSTLELQAEVQEVLDSNMMLELAEDEPETRDTAEAPAEAAETASEDHGDEPGAGESDLNLEDSDIPEDLPVDSAWEDVYDGGIGPTTGGGEGDAIEFEQLRGRETTLHDHLHWQLLLTRMSETDRAIATAIIDGINDDGYLVSSLEDVLQSLGEGPEVGLDEVEAVLHRVQAFDPPGVGARDLRECLLVQLRQMASATPWREEAIELVTNHLGLLAARDHAQIARRMRLDRAVLPEILNLIRQLSPRPGGQLPTGEAEFVVPDVIVRKHKGTWHVELNPEAMPRLRINPYYASLVRRADSSADNSAMKAHLQEARWFLKSLQSRSETLLRVATTIVERQRGFLEHGPEAMKPMVLHDVAEVLGMHESTISRVTTRKYMHTPRGIFELKYFFSSHLPTEDGGECSSTAIRALIKKLVATENPAKPLSDSRIASMLFSEGIQVARRTVAKYREGMAIPPSSERKRLA